MDSGNTGPGPGPALGRHLLLCALASSSFDGFASAQGFSNVSRVYTLEREQVVIPVSIYCCYSDM